MIIYNVTVKIEPDIQEEWVSWMKKSHIPDVMESGVFTGYKMCRIMQRDPDEGHTYAVQYYCNSVEDLMTYQRNFAPKLQQEHRLKYDGKYAAFRTVLEVLEDSNNK